jgi:hypothetical protein
MASASSGPEPHPGAFLQLERIVSLVLQELQREVVDVLRAPSPEGKLSASVVSMIRRATLGRVKRRLGPDGMAEFARALGIALEELDDSIGARIETAVAGGGQSAVGERKA